MILVVDKNSELVANFFADRLSLNPFKSLISDFFLSRDVLNKIQDELRKQHESGFKLVVTTSEKIVADYLLSRFSTDAIVCYPISLTAICCFYEEIAYWLGRKSLGQDVAQRFHSQIKTWIVNFSDRLKLKKVAVICGLNPLKTLGGYLAEICSMCSSRPFSQNFLEETDIRQLFDFNPDIIIFNISGSVENVLTLTSENKEFESCSAGLKGSIFYVPSNKYSFLNISPDSAFVNASIFISILADVDSGYMTPKQSFYKLSYIQMFRHKLGSI
ncbi:MAG: hypothetical protein NZO16_03805 [Deltaproteobacteria bacterium]|nr:hypothetical protein [Deltaproteobacteria bacterium]